jgi:hypothetical protein
LQVHEVGHFLSFVYKAYGIEILGGQCLTLFCSGRIKSICVKLGMSLIYVKYVYMVSCVLFSLAHSFLYLRNKDRIYISDRICWCHLVIG